MKACARAHASFLHSLIFCLPAGCLFLGMLACSSQPSQTESSAPPAQPGPAAGEPQRHALKGKVVSIDKTAKSMTVDHEEIPGFMGAMAMPYAVKDDALLDSVAPGDPVTAEVVVDDSGSMWLENIQAAPKPAQ